MITNTMYETELTGISFTKVKISEERGKENRVVVTLTTNKSQSINLEFNYKVCSICGNFFIDETYDECERCRAYIANKYNRSQCSRACDECNNKQSNVIKKRHRTPLNSTTSCTKERKSTINLVNMAQYDSSTVDWELLEQFRVSNRMTREWSPRFCMSVATLLSTWSIEFAAKIIGVKMNTIKIYICNITKSGILRKNKFRDFYYLNPELIKK